MDELSGYMNEINHMDGIRPYGSTLSHGMKLAI
jgi:hypothetical protein